MIEYYEIILEITHWLVDITEQNVVCCLSGPVLNKYYDYHIHIVIEKGYYMCRYNILKYYLLNNCYMGQTSHDIISL